MLIVCRRNVEVNKDNRNCTKQARENTVRYVQITGKLINQPDYEETLNQLEAVVREPEVQFYKGVPHACIPFKGDASPMVPIFEFVIDPSWDG